MTKIFFKEEQRYKQPWMWLILIPSFVAVIIIFGYGFNKQLFQGEPWGDKPMSDEGLLVVGIFLFLMMTGLTVLFYKMKLITEVREDGLYFRYPPLMMKFRIIKPDIIEKYEIRKYKPIREYGGWGIKTHGHKIKRNKFGTAYNVSGKLGLQLHLMDGKKILIGTQRGEALRHAMDKMMRDKE